MAKKRAAYHKQNQNRFSMGLVGLVVLLITAAVWISSIGLRQRYNELSAREEELRKQIALEDLRAEQIENYRKYTQTKRFFEEVAKEKLGLVYEGEIVFKEEN